MLIWYNQFFGELKPSKVVKFNITVTSFHIHWKKNCSSCFEIYQKLILSFMDTGIVNKIKSGLEVRKIVKYISDMLFLYEKVHCSHYH